LDTNQAPTVAIIGAGLAGLSCAVELTRAGISTRVFEASDRVGGRVRSDVVNGFTLDHGFQVLLTAYPACRQLLDYDALRLRPFEPGAMVRYHGSFSMLGDPWRRPFQALPTAFSSVGSFADKLRIARLRYHSMRGSLEDVFRRPQKPTLARLIDDGFSESMINAFFRPFLGGVYLDPSLETSSRMLEFVFRMFASGDIAIPADGMAAIPRQLAERLPRGTISLSRSVLAISDGSIYLGDGEKITPQRIIVATESHTASKLLGDESLATGWRTTSNHYFVCDQSPNSKRLLMLAGDEYLRDPYHRIGSVVVLSDIAPSYAPAGKSLISVSLAEGDSIEPFTPGEELKAVRSQLRNWFGAVVEQWQHLQTYRIQHGLPIVSLDSIESTRRIGNIIVSGDHLETPSIHGAMHSGLTAAKRILKSVTR
jgi:phytoene dehydrogenase-like protein